MDCDGFREAHIKFGYFLNYVGIDHKNFFGIVHTTLGDARAFVWRDAPVDAIYGVAFAVNQTGDYSQNKNFLHGQEKQDGRLSDREFPAENYLN